MSIKDLDLEYESYEKILDHNNSLREKQVELLSKQIKDSKPLIEWYRKKRFSFTHPHINYISNGGPILGFDEKESNVFIYNPSEGLLKINSKSNEGKSTFIEHLIENGHFKTAMEGLVYLNHMIAKYKSDLERDTLEREVQINQFIEM